MQTSTWNGLQLSRLMLGTAQFGMPYGVANQTGQPSYPDVVRILATAFEGGVNCFDTAAAYGTSEEVLGRALHELRIADHVTVVTKVLPLTAEESSDASAAAKAVERSVEASRLRLQLDCLPLVLFHREADAVFLATLESLGQRGLLKYCGVSCDNNPGPATAFVVGGRVSALQLPANVVDRRHRESGVFEYSQSLGIAVFVRSVYLQGLLVMNEEQIPAGLSGIIPVRRRLTALATQAGMTLGELAVRFMLTQNGVTCVIVGVETVSQVSDNIELFRRGPLPQDLLVAIGATVCEVSESLMTPSQWSSRSLGNRNMLSLKPTDDARGA